MTANKKNKAEYMICEAPVCVGSPTVGTEEAYSFLLRNGLCDIFGERADFSDFTSERSKDEILKDPRLIHIETVMHVCRELRKTLLGAFRSGYTPITVGGDHSIVAASLSAVSEMYGSENTALIYIDGHTDINTEKTTLTGRIHGMPLAAAMGLCTPLLDVGKNRVDLFGKNTYIIGAHSIDPAEWDIVKEQGVQLYTSEEVKARGEADVINEVLEKTAYEKVHVSFDVDSIDGAEFPATGYAMDGGLSYKCVYKMISEILKQRNFVSFDIVEYDPSRDIDGACLSKILDIFRLF